MYENKPYLRNPKTRAFLWVLLGFLVIGLGIFLLFFDENQSRHEESNSTETSIIEDSTTTAVEATYQAWEVTQTFEDQQLSTIVESQRSLVDACQQLQIESSVQVPESRASHVVFWIVREDGETVNKLIWEKTLPPPYLAPVSCLTDPLPDFEQGQGGVVIIQISHQFVGYYVPEGAPASATTDTRYPVYNVVVHLCMTDLATQTILGADEITLYPPSSVGYPGEPFLPGYAGNPAWRNQAEKWACNIPVTTVTP